MSTRAWVDCSAFPVTSEHYAGMSLRDYFAAKAMQGMLADLPKICYGPEWQDSVARTAFELADAMMASRIAP